jgi:hypothetical protein
MSWRQKFAVLAVVTLTLLSGSERACASQIQETGSSERSLFHTNNEVPSGARMDDEDECHRLNPENPYVENTEILELPVTIGPSDKALLHTLKGIHIRHNLQVRLFSHIFHNIYFVRASFYMRMVWDENGNMSCTHHDCVYMIYCTC